MASGGQQILVTSLIFALVTFSLEVAGQPSDDAVTVRGQFTESVPVHVRCNRLPVFPAPCQSNASPPAPVWFYDVASARCRQLPFVGCSLTGDSENSFETLEECQHNCVELAGSSAVTKTTSTATTPQLSAGSTTTSAPAYGGIKVNINTTHEEEIFDSDDDNKEAGEDHGTKITNGDDGTQVDGKQDDLSVDMDANSTPKGDVTVTNETVHDPMNQLNGGKPATESQQTTDEIQNESQELKSGITKTLSTESVDAHDDGDGDNSDEQIQSPKLSGDSTQPNDRVDDDKKIQDNNGPKFFRIMRLIVSQSDEDSSENDDSMDRSDDNSDESEYESRVEKKPLLGHLRASQLKLGPQSFITRAGASNLKSNSRNSDRPRHSSRFSSKNMDPNAMAKMVLKGRRKSVANQPTATTARNEIVCRLPVARGYCFASYQRWYFDSTTLSCRPFEYTGCGGNFNNFDDIYKCMRVCQTTVATPICRGTSCTIAEQDKNRSGQPMTVNIAVPQQFNRRAENFDGPNPGALHTLTIMMPFHLNGGEIRQNIDNEASFKSSEVQRAAQSSQKSTRNEVNKPVPFQPERRDQQQQQQQQLDVINWNSSPISQGFLPSVMANNEQRNMMLSRLLQQQLQQKLQQQKQQNVLRRQMVLRQPAGGLLKNDLMMTSISYGLMSSNTPRTAENFMNPLYGSSVMELPLNRQTQRSSWPIFQSRDAIVEDDEERLQSDWKRPSMGKSRKRVIPDEDYEQKVIRHTSSLNSRNYGERSRGGTSDRRSRKSKAQESRKSQSSRKTQKKLWRQQEPEKRPFYGRSIDVEEIQPNPFVPRLPVNERLSLFQIVVRRQHGISHHGTAHPSPLTDNTHMPMITGNMNEARLIQGPPLFINSERAALPHSLIDSSQQLKSNNQQPTNGDNRLSPPVVFVTANGIDDDAVQSSYVCFLPLDIGNCKSYQNKWYFNPNTGRCEVFFYGGCGGNGNRFDQLDTCKRTCTPNFVATNPQKDEVDDSKSSGSIDRDQIQDESTTPGPSDVIVVTSPVYVPMTREDLDADTQTETISLDVTSDTAEGVKTVEQTTSSSLSVDHGITEQSTHSEQQPVASQVGQSVLTGFSSQYIAIVSVLGAVGLVVIILVIITIVHMCRKVHKSKKEIVVEDVVKAHMYGDLPQIVYTQPNAISNKYDEKL